MSRSSLGGRCRGGRRATESKPSQVWRRRTPRPAVALVLFVACLVARVGAPPVTRYHEMVEFFETAADRGVPVILLLHTSRRVPKWFRAVAPAERYAISYVSDPDVHEAFDLKHPVLAHLDDPDAPSGSRFLPAFFLCSVQRTADANALEGACARPQDAIDDIKVWKRQDLVPDDTAKFINWLRKVYPHSDSAQALYAYAAEEHPTGENAKVIPIPAFITAPEDDDEEL